MSRSISRYQKKLAIHLSITIGVIVVLVGIIISSGSSIKEESLSIGSRRTEFAKKLSVVRALAEARAGLRRAESAERKLQNVIPEKEKLINLSQDLSRVAQRGDLGYTFSFIEEQQATAEAPGFVRFRLSLDGTFGQFVTFLENVKTFQYVTRVDEVLVNYGKMEVVGSVFFHQSL